MNAILLYVATGDIPEIEDVKAQTAFDFIRADIDAFREANNPKPRSRAKKNADPKPPEKAPSAPQQPIAAPKHIELENRFPYLNGQLVDSSDPSDNITGKQFLAGFFDESQIEKRTKEIEEYNLGDISNYVSLTIDVVQNQIKTGILFTSSAQATKLMPRYCNSLNRERQSILN